ncbi:MAG: hypothetical protein DRQ64_02785 [Gammaproteobacteria bacterium]|nr:MAG: hypothetical protein DRQ64_02785 [Gammaproteobacteria bacterium]
MYSQFFGLNGPPFRITPDTTFFYSGGEREALINAIAYAISHGDGIIKVVGEVGSGKTMISRMLANRLPENTTLVYLLNPSLQASDLIYAIGRDLGIGFDSACSKTDALQLVQNKLLAMHAKNQRAVVFIDEAQCMPLETLEELRLLSNLETETDKLLQLVLFGQPELDQHLSHNSVRQIKERIIHSFYLKPFTASEVGEYLSFRLHKAGYNGSPIFSASALRLLTRYSSGLPRKLTIFADKSLLAAFATQSNIVEACHVRLAVKDSGQLSGLASKNLLAVFAVILLAFVLVIAYYNSYRIESDVNSQAPAISSDFVAEEYSSNNDDVTINIDDSQKPVYKAPVKVLTQGVNVDSVTLEVLTKKTKDWMAVSNGAVYTIQILSANANDDKFLEHFFLNVAENIGLDDLYVHPVSIGDNSFFAVTLGGFTTLDGATNYLESLPVFIRRYQPYIKNISSFKRTD